MRWYGPQKFYKYPGKDDTIFFVSIKKNSSSSTVRLFSRSNITVVLLASELIRSVLHLEGWVIAATIRCPLSKRIISLLDPSRV
jgi:hypothetical protein